MKINTLFTHISCRSLLSAMVVATMGFMASAESETVTDADTGLNFVVNTSGRSVTSVLFSGGKLADDGALPIPQYISYKGERVEVSGIADNLGSLSVKKL